MLSRDFVSVVDCDPVQDAELPRLRQAVDASAEIIFMTDASGIITFVNRQFEAVYEHNATDVIGRTTPRVLKGGSVPAEQYAEFWQRLRRGETVRREFLNATKSGRAVLVEAVISPTWNADHTAIIGFLGVQRDITGRRRAEADLRQKNMVLATEHETTIDGILVVDEHDMVLSFNQRFVALWGITSEVLASGHDGPLLASVVDQVADPEAFLSRVRLLYERRDQTSRDEIVLKDGRTFDRYTAPMHDTEGRYYGRVWFFRDITEQKHAQQALLETREQLRHDALYDRLTGLPNRALLMERLEGAVRRTRRHPERGFALLFVDLDGFKLVNDSLGHDVGDQLLMAFSRRLEGCLRQEDTLARIGGDEFVVLIGDIENVTAAALAARIHTELQPEFVLGPHTLVMTASIGIASSLDLGGGTAQDLLRDADTAMYRAKKGGKARFAIFTTGMHEEAVQRFQLEHDLRGALARREFFALFQPIVSARTGEVSALEALIRWQHPGRGLVAPGEFISIADELGLMIPIGEWMLRSACEARQAWIAAGHRPVRVAVNVSPGQFRDPQLADMVQRVLHETHTEPGGVELELSENIVLQSAESTSTQLERLAKTGVRLSVDDFGVVHTSVRYLARYPISTLKIDRVFVRDIAVDRAGKIVMKALIELGHSLGLNVVVEGVETADQEMFVRACGCDETQGYHVGAVMTADQAAALLDKQWATEAGPLRALRSA